MPRLALASLCALSCALVAFSAEPEQTPVEKQLAVQSAMASARKCLDANMPAEAVAELEKELSRADGAKAYLNLLREAYLAELSRLEKDPSTNAERIARTRRKFALLGGNAANVKSAEPELGPPLVVPAAGKSPAPPSGDGNPWRGTSGAQPTSAPPTAPAKAEDAVAAFKKGDFAGADKLFAAAGAAKLTPEQKTAWAYCRIKLAADRVNAPNCDPAAAANAAQDVADALELICDNAKLLATGRQVLKSAQAKAKPGGGTAVAGELIETASFRVAHGGNRELGEAVAKAAEAGRKQVFERWSGPPSGSWQPKCLVVIHATAGDYAKATGKPAALTGHATIKLTNGRATERRIDLRADDTALVANALPRELTHVALADLFADKPPPRWALEGMAVLAGSQEEIDRYARTLPRCARDGELRSLAAFFELKDFPADKITGYYCQSVSVTEYLIKLRGERNFKIFLGDAQRYGVPQALKRQYNIDGPQSLEAAWKRACLEQARGQAP
jgi:hypothetical protein